MDKFRVTVTYGDQSKKIPLVVTPGTELSCFQREEAHKHLKRAVRSVFSLPPGAELGFYDRQNGYKLTPFTFTTHSELFPRRWTLMVESAPASAEGGNSTSGDSSPPSTVKVAPRGQSNGVAPEGNGLMTNGRDSPLTDGESLSHLYMVDSGKEVRMIRGETGYGCVLRHFTIQENHSLDDGDGSNGSDDSSLDVMTTVFVHKVYPDGAAERVGIREGDKVFSIGGERITSASREDVVSLLKLQEEELVMVVCPKADDVLQLSGFAAIGYGKTGEYDTKYGHAEVYEIDLGPDSGDEEMAGGRGRHESGSSYSIDSSHRITPEQGSKSAPVSDSLERGGRESSQSGSAHLVNSMSSSHEDNLHQPTVNTSAFHEDVFIHNKVSGTPLSPQGPPAHTRRASPWAVGGDVHTMMLEHRSLAELTSVHQRNTSELSTDSMGDLPETRFQHLRQISDVSVDSVDDPVRRLSMEGRLFSEVELAQIGRSATLPSGASPRMWSESNATGTEEGPFSLSPIDNQHDSSPEQQRRLSLRKPSLEDLTQMLEEGASEPLPSPPVDNQLSDSTLRPQSLSQHSVRWEEAKKRSIVRSYSSQTRRHRPSMIAALEEPILSEVTASRPRSRGANSLSTMKEATGGEAEDRLAEEIKLRPKRSGSMGTPGVGREQRLSTSSHKSQSLEHLEEVGKDVEPDDVVLLENRHMQSQPEPSLLRITPRPRPHSAGAGRMSLRYALCHGPLNRKVERDDTGKKAHDRSWRGCYAVAKGESMHFYKDLADAEQGGTGFGHSLKVVGAQVGIPEDYRKKTHVFRVISASGLVMLFHTDSSRSVKRWIETLREISGLDMEKMDSLDLSGYQGDSGVQNSSLSIDLSESFGGRSTRRSSGQTKDDSKKFLSKFKKLMTGGSSDTTTFGVPLEACPLSETHPFVPRVMDLCISEIERRGLENEGLYRMQGNESVVSSLISEMNKGNFDAPSVSEEWQDIKVVTTLLKRFLKQLPDSLIIKGMYHDFITAARAPTEEGRVQRIKELIGQLPPAHFHTLRHFARHLATIEKHSQHNKMTASNLAIVFGPTLLNSPDEDSIVKDMNASHKLIETLVLTHEELFDQPSPQTRVRRASDEPALTQPNGIGQQSKPTKIPGRKSSSLSAATGLGVRKPSRTQLTMDWIQKSDFQGSQEDSENEDTVHSVQRRNVGSMWAKPQPQQHVKRRISQQLRYLNSGGDSPQPLDSPATPPDVRSKSSTIDGSGRHSQLKRKQSYAVAMGASMTPDTDSKASRRQPRSRFLSTESPQTDGDVLKDFLGGDAKEPSHRMVYNFVTKETETVRESTAGSSHNSPLTTYQESFL